MNQLANIDWQWSEKVSGEMRERLNRTVSKTVVPSGTQGSNPCLSAELLRIEFILLITVGGRGVREV